jgi:bifunctional pyridoxal-dependent enzyme with beta-cystathionase and maltose regulon repressor activities
MRACVANSEFSGPSSLSDLAASSILSDDAFLEAFIKTNRLRLAQNYKIATEFLVTHDIPYKEGSNAGLFVWADLFAPNQTKIKSLVIKQQDAGKASQETLVAMEEEMTDVLLKHRIFLASGGDFGTDVSGWFRIVFAHERTYLLEGLERMVRAVEAFGLELGKD